MHLVTRAAVAPGCAKARRARPREDSRATFPILAEHDPRQAAGVSRQRGHFAKAARGPRRHRALLRAPERQHSSRRAHAQRARYRGARCGAGNGAAFHQRRRYARDYLCARRHRSHQPGGADVWTQACGRRRRSAHHRHGAPLEHRAVADAVRREGRAPSRCAHQRSRRAAAGRV